MYILAEENTDLKEDLERLRNMTYEQRVKDITKTNKDLMKRNGTLLIELENAKEAMDKLQAETSGKGVSNETKKSEGIQRPQTASIRKRKAEMLMNEEDLELAQTAYDRELNELLAKNQKQLNELHQDMKEVSKIAGEPTVQVRKINNPGQRKKILKENNNN